MAAATAATVSTTAVATAPVTAADTKQTISFDSLHEDIIHDSQFDYYGKRVATCSSDKTIKIFDIDGELPTLFDTLKGHTGPVWAVAWAHPKFGAVLASASHDGRVIIWKETEHPQPQMQPLSHSQHQPQQQQGATGRQFIKVHEHTRHSASVNGISWAPHEHGLMLACASSDGFVSILVYVEETGSWDGTVCFAAHAIGVLAVSWAPAIATGATESGVMAPRLATGGCDNLVKLWSTISSSSQTVKVGNAPQTLTFECTATLEGHDDWVRDVAWAPGVGIPAHYLASCSQDKTVCVWVQENLATTGFERHALPAFPEAVWRVVWSHGGDRLAVSCGDSKVTLWRETISGEWECVRTVDD